MKTGRPALHPMELNDVMLNTKVTNILKGTTSTPQQIFFHPVRMILASS